MSSRNGKNLAAFSRTGVFETRFHLVFRKITSVYKRYNLSRQQTKVLQKSETQVCNKTLIEGEKLRGVKIFKKSAIVAMVLYCGPQFSLARTFDMHSCYSALSVTLKSQCHPKCFARLCFCLKFGWRVCWTFRRLYPAALAFQQADIYSSSL